MTQATQPRAQANPDAPIIIYGSVRAGTTMFRLILGAHPDLVEIGENRFLVDCLIDKNSESLRYDIDRLEADRVFRVRGVSRHDRRGADLV